MRLYILRGLIYFESVLFILSYSIWACKFYVVLFFLKMNALCKLIYLENLRFISGRSNNARMFVLEIFKVSLVLTSCFFLISRQWNTPVNILPASFDFLYSMFLDVDDYFLYRHKVPKDRSELSSRTRTGYLMNLATVC